MIRALTLLLCLLCASTAAAQSVATVTTNAPIYVEPRESQTPLRVAAVGTRLRVLAEAGEWIQVEFQDPKYGRRVGYIARRFVGITNEATKPKDVSVAERPAPAAPAVPPVVQSVETRQAYPTTETALGWSVPARFRLGAGPELRAGVERLCRRQSFAMAWHRGRRDRQLQNKTTRY